MREQLSFTQAQKIRYMFILLERAEITIHRWWTFIEGLDKPLLEEVMGKVVDAEQRLDDFATGSYFRNKIRKYCNYLGHTDWEPYEVVRKLSPKCVEIRPMEAVPTSQPKEFSPGGFTGHFSDVFYQDYDFFSDEDAQVIRIRLGKRGWGNGKFHMSDIPVKFYDFNF